MNLTEVIVCADQGENDSSHLNGYVKVEISGIDGKKFRGSLAGVPCCCGDISSGMSPRKISMLPRETTKVANRRSQVQLFRFGQGNGFLECSKGNINTGNREEKEATACSSVTTCVNENVHTDSIIRPLRMKPRVNVPRLEVKPKFYGKSSTKIWYPCFSGANSPFKHSRCSLTRKKCNPSIDVCYQS